MTIFKNNFEHFSNRAERQQFIINLFPKLFAEARSILDVGCSENELKNILGDRVTGLDISGCPDKFVNFEVDQLKIIEDSSFDSAVCIEVLEHLDNLHSFLDELFRVSKKNVLISLPNLFNIENRLRILLKGDLGKYYGLPLKKPVDRHKWTFGYQHIVSFVEGYSINHKVKIVEFVRHYNYVNKLTSLVSKIAPMSSLVSDCFILFSKC